MVLSALMWAHTIGTFCGIVASFDPEGQAFRATLDTLNQYMRQEKLPHGLRQRLRAYFHHSKDSRRAETQRELLEELSPSLQGEVAWQVNRGALQKVPFLSRQAREFLVELSISLNSVVFAPGDWAPDGFLYIVHVGIALRGGRLLHKGATWGEDVLLHSLHLRSKVAARAMNFLTCFHLNRLQLLSTATKYPLTFRRLRREIILLALRRDRARRPS
jgi:hypothetical protein